MIHETPTHGQSPRGFTLIEVMIVVGIIVVLGAIGLAVGTQVKRSAAENATKLTLETLRGAMSIYLKEHPEPIIATPGTEPNWFAALQATGKMPSSLHIVGNNVLDGFNNPIHYIPANTAPYNKPTGFFLSYGSDGVLGGNNDLFSDGVTAQ